MTVNQEAVVRIRVDPGNTAQATQQVATSLGRVGEAGQVSARQTAAAMRQLPAQFTDIATQLAGGSNPLLVLLQQGGQIKDSFGGIGPAIRGVTAAISPMAVAVGAAAAAVGGLGAAYLAGQREAQQLRDTIILTGNAAGLTADRLTEISERTAALTGQTIGGARSIALALAQTGRTTAGVFESQAEAIARIADLSGRSAKEIAQNFAQQMREPTRFAVQLNEQYNFLNVAQYKRIAALEEAGRKEEAAIETNRLLNEQFKTQREQLGLLESAWDGIASAASRAWDAVKNFGRPDTFKELIDAETQRLATLEKVLAGKLSSGYGDRPLNGRTQNDDLRDEIAASRDRLRRLIDQRDRADIGAWGRSEDAARVREELEKRERERRSRSDAPRVGPPVDYNVLDARDAMAAAGARREAEESRIAGFFSQQLQAQEERDARALAQQIAAAERRMDVEQDYLQGLADANERAAINMMADEEARGRALVELDAAIARRRLDARVARGEISSSARDIAAGLIDEGAALEARAFALRLGENTYTDVRNALSNALRDTDNPLQAFGDALGNIVFQRVTARLADALATAAVGRDGQGGLFGSIVSALLGAATTGGGTRGMDTGNYGGGLADGGRAMAGRMLLVGERGPELLNMGATSGYVVPNHRLGMGAFTFAPQTNITVDARADRAAVVAELQAMLADSQRATLEQLRAEGLLGR